MRQRLSATTIYVSVAAALLLLLGLTVALATVDLGPFNLVIALAIAIAKATLVVLFFMHIRGSGGVLRIVAAAGIVWLMFMFILTLTDFLTRT